MESTGGAGKGDLAVERFEPPLGNEGIGLVGQRWSIGLQRWHYRAADRPCVTNIATAAHVSVVAGQSGT